MKQYIVSIFTVLSFYIIDAYVTYAAGVDTGEKSKATGGAGGGGELSIKIQNPIADVTVAELLTKVLKFLIQLGSVAVVLAIVYAGFLFVVAQGSPDKINKAKDALKWSIIGGAILLGAQLIAQVIQTTLKELA